jgi:hypothetical protein
MERQRVIIEMERPGLLDNMAVGDQRRDERDEHGDNLV